MTEDELVFDIETNGLLPEVSRLWLLIISNPKTDVVDVYSDVAPGCRPVSEGVERLRRAKRIIGHNILQYDLLALEILGIKLDWHKAIDTLVLSRLSDPAALGGWSLGRWGEILKCPKGDFTEFEQFTPEMVPYGIQDVRLNVKVWHKVKHLLDEMPDAVETEHYFAWCMGQQMRDGFCLDRPKAEALYAELIGEQAQIETELQAIFPPIWVPDGATVEKAVMTPKRTVNYRDVSKPGLTAGAAYTKVKLEMFNPGSRPQVAKRLIRKYGWKPSKFTPGGAPAIDEDVLEGMPYPEAKAMFRYLKATKRSSMVKSWLEAERDGRVHGYINTIGANTHRCTHRDPNLAQVDKKEPRMREVWTASPGRKLVGCDGEGLELRMLGHYLGRYDGGAFAEAVVNGDKAAGTDAHSRNRKIARAFDREAAKTLIYAYLYGAGNPKLGRTLIDPFREAGKYNPTDAPHLFNSKGRPLPPAVVGKQVRERLNKGITGLGKLQETLQEAAKKGWIRGIDGRRVKIRSAHAALNTLLQSAGAIVMKKAMRIFYGWSESSNWHGSYGFAANVHDEQQFDCDPEVTDLVGQKFAEAITEAGRQFNMRCPLAGAYDIGDNWRETH